MFDPTSALVAASLLPAIVGAHALYFRAGARHSTQHRFRVVDESRQTGLILRIEGDGARSLPTPSKIVALHSDSKVEGDLHLSEDCRYRSAIKITGDLIVEGNAIFDGPVIVNGYVRIAGSATFAAGLLVKSDLWVTGLARFGQNDSGSWCVARKTMGKIVEVPAAIDDDYVDYQDKISA